MQLSCTRLRSLGPDFRRFVGLHGCLLQFANPAAVPWQDSTSAVKDRLEETVKGGRADAAEITRRGQGARVERTERELREAEEALASQELERWDEVFRSQSEQRDKSR